jgi:nucleoside 2-deoxyribosyltransferase
MENVKIYLSGGMGNLSFEEQSKWRNQVINAIKFGDYHCEKKPIFFNPVEHYNFTEVRYRSEKEVMEFDLNALRHSDLVIVNFNDPKSIGTAMELMLAKEMHIPVIGWNPSGEHLHSWLAECTTRLCDDLRETVEHVVDFYLN